MRRVSPLRSDGSYDVDEASLDAGLSFGPEDKSLAIQSQRDDSDINVIVKRFGLTGELPVHQRVPLQLDIDDMLDYRVCMQYVRSAQESFNSLPASVRAEFRNDAASFVDFAGKAENLPKLREWGLAPAAVVPPSPPAAPAESAAGGGS